MWITYTHTQTRTCIHTDITRRASTADSICHAMATLFLLVTALAALANAARIHGNFRVDNVAWKQRPLPSPFLNSQSQAVNSGYPAKDCVKMNLFARTWVTQDSLCIYPVPMVAHFWVQSWWTLHPTNNLVLLGCSPISWMVVIDPSSHVCCI